MGKNLKFIIKGIVAIIAFCLLLGIFYTLCNLPFTLADYYSDDFLPLLLAPLGISLIVGLYAATLFVLVAGTMLALKKLFKFIDNFGQGKK